MKKILSFLLCFVLLISTFIPAFASEKTDRTDIPVIYIVGTGKDIVRETETGEKETLYPIQIPDNYINDQLEVFLPVFAEAFFTQEWDEFCDVLYEIISPILSKMKLDKNGEASDGSHVDWSWSRESLTDKKSNGTYHVQDYTFFYDWRVDLYETADLLHQYIEDVMYVTGAEEVAILGRCLGSNLMSAYMQKYDGQYVRETIHYASAVNGASFMSKIFTGEELYLHADGIERFLYDFDLGIGKELTEILRSFVTMLNKTYGLDIACWAVNNVYKDIYLDIIPRILIESYASFPSYWSMICPEDYEKAKETIYYGSDLEEYSIFIQKTDRYFNDVQLNFEKTSKKHSERGIEISNIVKYGTQDVPITKESDELSDFLCLVKDASFGATSSLVNETLSSDYIKAMEANGKGEYISPEKQIDASTCLFPETTWFVKALHHFYFPNPMNALISQIINIDGFTVDSDKDFPRYLLYNNNTSEVSPLTAENMNTTPEWNTSYFEALKKFFANLISLIVGLVNNA